jgi:hypothetical protein
MALSSAVLLYGFSSSVLSTSSGLKVDMSRHQAVRLSAHSQFSGSPCSKYKHKNLS